MAYISPAQTKAKSYAAKYDYKLRKIKDGYVKVIRPNGSIVTVKDWNSAWELMMCETVKVDPNKNIFDF